MTWISGCFDLLLNAFTIISSWWQRIEGGFEGFWWPVRLACTEPPLSRRRTWIISVERCLKNVSLIVSCVIWILTWQNLISRNSPLGSRSWNRLSSRSGEHHDIKKTPHLDPLEMLNSLTFRDSEDPTGLAFFLKGATLKLGAPRCFLGSDLSSHAK